MLNRAQFGQTTSRSQFWLLNCLIKAPPKSHLTALFYTHTPSPGTHIHTQLGPSGTDHSHMELLSSSALGGWILQASYSLLSQWRRSLWSEPSPSLYKLPFWFVCLFFSLRCKWIAKITLSFPCRVRRLEDHSMAILLILYFPILLGIFCLTKYQLSKRHQLFISSDRTASEQQLNCLKFRTKHLKQIIYL